MLPADLLDALNIDSSAVNRVRAVRGGDSDAAYCVETKTQTLFFKTARFADAGRFDAESAGLERLARSRTLRVPAVHAVGAAGKISYLVLEWLTLGADLSTGAAALGRGLARMHRASHASFGLDRDNFIGLGVQRNARCARWCDFFVTQRLGVQADVARRSPATEALYEPMQRLLPIARQQLSRHQPAPSLLHGDLWSGNWGVLDNNEPVIFDPAVYFGDRETDLAMTRLFGGFPDAFYRAYQEIWPLPDDYLSRQELYQLYHVVNHANIFGGHYVQQALHSIARCSR
ncbi:MAG: fructosamine kinase family protein [Gammaproteobacteria bacterium]